MSNLAKIRQTLAERVPITERRTVGALIAAFVLLASFVTIAHLVQQGRTHAFDQSVILFFREAGDTANPVGPAWLEGTVRDITALGSTVVCTLIVTILAGFLLITGKRNNAIYLVAAVGGGAAMNSVFKIGFARPRPDIVAHGAEVYTASFPSGHSMNSAVVYLTLGLLIARSQTDQQVKSFIFAVSIFMTFIIGLSRIYLGVHWPTDVLAGWTLGLLWALLCWALMLRLQQSGEIEQSAARRSDTATR